MLWLDNSADAGESRAQPYSSCAGIYHRHCDEAVTLGVKRIILDNAQLSTGYGQEYATYGSNAVNVTVGRAFTFIDTHGYAGERAWRGTQSLYFRLAALGAHNSYYGSNPLTLANSNVTSV